MLHPVFKALLRQPDLLLEHAAGYAALVREEAQSLSGELVSRLLAWALAVIGFLLFIVLAGTAAMLGAITHSFHWMLLLVPGTALALSAVAFLQARRRLPQPLLGLLRAQLEADARTLRTPVGA
jgi:hypothetical protein